MKNKKDEAIAEGNNVATIRVGIAIGTYLYPHFANKGKVKKILHTLKEYRKTAQK